MGKFKYRIFIEGIFTFAENGIELDRIVRDILADDPQLNPESIQVRVLDIDDSEEE